MLDRVPQFWQGVLASLLATVVVGIAIQLWKLFSSQAQKLSRSKQEDLLELRRKMSSSDSILRTEGYFVAVFRLFRYLFIGSILWIIAWGLSFFGFVLGLAGTIVALSAYYVGIKWLSNVTRPAKTQAVDPSGHVLELKSAKYGIENAFADVTSVLAEQIVNGRLHVYAGNQLAGDPCPGKVKELVVEYSYSGQQHVRRIPEGEILSLP